MATKPAPKKEAKGSTAVAVRKAHNIVDIQAKIKADMAAIGDRTQSPSGNKIKAARGQFTLPNGQTTSELDVVIVDSRITHNFWPEKFDPKNIKPVACFAIGMNPKAMIPSANSPSKQASDCQSCPMNQFGSDGEGKACKNGRRLALLPAMDETTDVDAEAEIWVIDVSPTALKGFDGYMRSVAATFSTPLYGVLTTISLDSTVDYAKLKFDNPRPIGNIGDAMSRQAEAVAMLEAEPDVSGYAQAYAAKPVTAARKPATARR